MTTSVTCAPADFMAWSAGVGQHEIADAFELEGEDTHDQRASQGLCPQREPCAGVFGRVNLFFVNECDVPSTVTLVAEEPVQHDDELPAPRILDNRHRLLLPSA